MAARLGLYVVGLVLCLYACLSSAKIVKQKLPPVGLSYVCRAEFTFDPFGIELVSGIHTFIGHGTPCTLPGCGFYGPSSWSTVGFDTGSTVQLWGPGRLIQETYDCIDVQPSSTMATECARAAVHLMTQRGWPEDAYYKVWRIAYFCNGNVTQEDCSPSPEGNVCWQWTCGVLDCAYPKIVAQRGEDSCPTPSALIAQVKAGERELPHEWNCSSEHYADGKVCHCHCGSLDPDCLQTELPSANCPNGGICLPPGNVCADPDRVKKARNDWQKLLSKK